MAPLPGMKTSVNSVIRIPQIARWRVAGISERKIAELLQVGPGTLTKILCSQEYIDYEAAYLNGHLSEMDRKMAGRRDLIQAGLREAVPAALRCLVDTVTQRRDMKAAFAAAREILDRDPDRTLQIQAEPTQGAQPELPAGVLDAVVTEGNKMAEDYNKDPQKPKVN